VRPNQKSGDGDEHEHEMGSTFVYPTTTREHFDLR